MQIRTNAESVAFFKAGVIEAKKTNLKLNKLISVQQGLILREYALNCKI